MSAPVGPGVGPGIQPNAPDVALVFEGGGMRASYSSGVLTALVEAGIVTGWVGGISAGSSCTFNYLTRDTLRARKSFVDLAATTQFGNIGTWVRGKGMFHSEYIYERTSGPGQFLEYNMPAHLAARTRYAIGAFACESGQMRYWGPEDMQSLESLVVRVRASSTMPLLMPWTTVDSVVYCDGALGPTGGFAHDAARADGFAKFLVITTRERGYRKPPQRTPAVMNAALRRYPRVAAALNARPAHYNRSLEELHDLESSGDAFLIFPETMPIKNSERRVPVLLRMYRQGLAQGRRLIPQIRTWAGIEPRSPG
ncbi:MAG: patatin family protein [Dermabacter sp.]|nr:patatin family protein [Dermabacter sp.]